MELELSKRQKARLQKEYPEGLALSLQPQQAVTEALKAAYSAGYVGAWARDTASYQLFCERMSLTPFPVQAMALMAYLADRVVRRGLEPAGLTASRSILRTAVTKGRLGWALDETDEALVAQMQRGLVKTYKGQNARGQKDPVTLFHLRLMMGQHASAQEAQDLLQMRLAHGGFLRTGEHANGKLLVGDVEFLTEEKPGALGRVTICLRERIVGVCLKLRQAKTGHLETPPQEALIGRRSDALDVVGPLWDYMVAHGLQSTGHESEPLFTRLDERGRRTDKPCTSEQFRAAVAAWMKRIGSHGGNWGGHSLRRGACNDALDGGVPLEVVMKAGRWKSMAVMVYRRLTWAAMRVVAAVSPQETSRNEGPLSRVYYALKEGSKGMD